MTLALLVLAPEVSLGGIAGSRHDFSGITFGSKGVCDPCHIPHGASGPPLWKRSLTDEAAYFTPVDDPNYVPGRTLLCYDCHDDMLTVADRDPPGSVWSSGGQPQDIAFSATAADAARWKSSVGYYELKDGTSPRTGSPPRSTAVDVTTGGHFWKSTPTGTPAYRRGDKIPCSLCHNPHGGIATSNDAFFRFDTPNGNGSMLTLGDGFKASPNSRHQQLGGTGREMCAACHHYSDYTGILEKLWKVDVMIPPPVLPEHLSTDSTPCTNCHKHNKIALRCDDCHGYPPTTVGDGWSGSGDTDENYPGGAGAHLAHIKGAGKTAADPDKYSFGCLGGACHPSSWHDQNSGVVLRSNVQVAFAGPTNPNGAVWNPNGVFTSGGTPASDACTKLYCHSNGLVENGLNPNDNGKGESGLSGRGEYAESSGRTTFYGTTIAKPATWGGSLDCKGCHGKAAPNYLRDGGTLPGGPSANIAVSPPDYLNAGQHTISGDNANGVYNDTGANTHFIHVYKIPFSNDGGCNCHGNEAPGVAPAKHVNRQNDITYCSNQCHNPATNYTWGGKYGTTPGGNNCAWWCHGIQRYDSPGGRVNKSTFFADPNPGYMEAGHGLPTTSTYSSGNPGAGIACEACHLATDRLTTNGALEQSYHYERMATATGNAAAPLSTNPYWLKAPYASGQEPNGPDGLCASCHDGATAVDARNHTAQGVYLNANFIPVHSPPPSPTYVWTSFTPNCINCHDPHGEPNWFMLYDNNPEKSTNVQEAAYSGPVIYKGSRYGVTRAQADQYGFPPSTPSYPANQTPVTMTGSTNVSDFVNASNTGICQICHTLTSYYRRDGTNPGGPHLSLLCTTCHKHPGSFGQKCESCHASGACLPISYQHEGCDGIPGTADDAPNVMGDGCSPGGTGGTKKPFDDGAYGFNVNGHGANGTAVKRPTVALAPNRRCIDCHDLALPSPVKHFDCSTTENVNQRINTRYYFGKPADTRNANSSHLKPGFLAGANDPQSKQIAFDDYCYNTCHSTDPGGVQDMRHSYTNGNYDPVSKIMQFNVASNVTDDPKQDRGADNVWTPWTIDDLTNVVDANPPTTRHHGVCVSCHDPHGTSTLQKTRSTNKMVIRNWQDTAMPTFCGSNCHKVP